MISVFNYFHHDVHSWNLSGRVFFSGAVFTVVGLFSKQVDWKFMGDLYFQDEFIIFRIF